MTRVFPDRSPLRGSARRRSLSGEGSRTTPLPDRSAALRRPLLPHKGGGESSLSRWAIVSAARGWIGTPYHHQASLKGAGCDCLGLIRGIWRELLGAEPERLPPYSRDWGDATGAEPLLRAAFKHLTSVAVADAEAGDVLVFRMQAGVAKHAGVLAEGSLTPRGAARFIHSQEGLGVTEAAMGLWWRRRAVAAFKFPGVR